MLQGFFRKGEVEYKAGQYAMALMSYKVRIKEPNNKYSAHSGQNGDTVWMQNATWVRLLL